MYFVDLEGDDTTGNGSFANPWGTPWFGAAQLASGDALVVNDGIWTVTSSADNIWISAGGTGDLTRTIVMAAHPGGAQIINAIAPANVANTSDAAIVAAADFVDIVGFDVSGANGRIGIVGYGQNGAGSGSPVGSHIRVQQCTVHDLGQSVNPAYNCYGIYAGQFSTETGYMGTENEVSRCETWNIGQPDQPGCHGIYLTTGGGVCQNNIVSNCAGFGINFYHFPHHMTISNNLVFKCGTNATTPHQGGGIYLSSATTGTAEACDFCVVNNNIVRECIGYAGIYEEQPVGVTVVANNTFSNNDFYGNSGATFGDYHFGSGATSVNQVPLLSTSTSGADTFTRANQSGLGTASDGETWANTGDTANLVLSILSNQGKATGSANDNFLLLGTKIISDFDAVVRVSTSASNTGNWQGILARYLNPTTFYAAIWRGGHFSIMRSLQGAAHNDIADTTFAFVANTEYKIHFNLTGTTLSANAWLASGSEPGGWMVQVTDTNLAKGQVGLFVSPDVTGTTAVYDSFTYTATQVSERDPLFVNYQADGSGDYHLQAGSPCIDAGTGSGAPPVDLDGNARPRGAGFDIGPYEFLSVLSYADYRDTIEPNLVSALATAGLTTLVKLIGPDTATGDDAWVVSSSADLASTLSGYVRHTFPAGGAAASALYGAGTYGAGTYGAGAFRDTAISSGLEETEARALLASIAANDPTNKPVFQGEMGDGALGPGALVTNYQYGVEMADYAVQLARAGMAALVAYLLDDDMHGAQWGMWQITEGAGTPRPWFFLWSLLCRTLVPGSTLYAPAQPDTGDFRALAAQSPQGAWTVVLINRRAGTTRASVSVPFAPLATGTFQQYLYREASPPATDGNGFPLASGSVAVVLPRGVTVALPANSALVLTQAAATVTSLYDVKRPPLQKRR